MTPHGVIPTVIAFGAFRTWKGARSRAPAVRGGARRKRGSNREQKEANSDALRPYETIPTTSAARSTKKTITSQLLPQGKITVLHFSLFTHFMSMDRLTAIRCICMRKFDVGSQAILRCDGNPILSADTSNRRYIESQTHRKSVRISIEGASPFFIADPASANSRCRRANGQSA